MLSYSGDKDIFLEYYITINCNLNCVACSTFSPLVKGKNTFIDLEYIKKDFQKMYEISEEGKRIWKLSLMGGEPLMHPEINQIIKYFGDLGIKMRIVTNGILIPRMDDQFFDYLKAYDVDLKVSIYKIVKYEKIFKKLKDHGVKYGIFTLNGEFGHKYLHNEKKGVTDCRYRGNMYILRDGKVYTCSETAFFDIFDEAFKKQHNLTLTEYDYVDLDDVESMDELIEKRKVVPPLCEYCDGSEKSVTKWDISKGEIGEWMNMGDEDKN